MGPAWFLITFGEGQMRNPLTELDEQAREGAVSLYMCVKQQQGDPYCGRNCFVIPVFFCYC